MANKKIPMRKCVGCQEMKEKKSLIRVVKTAEGDIILDDTGKKTAGELIYVRVLNALKRLKRQRHLSDPLVLVYQNKYMRSLKRR